ncbi:DUF1653 domain-containing protein [Motiliproteus coralliicola]|uniref:DUF1653 domain-containing protein n=1 Tax=Motiliproteus coralliicola TaxID=2283196 RepID=A0A369WQG6_9GAMM|nr:DUF1653 domain-containing protein [Motiliproteus coralliicola]RDE24320.1 DUF1653 domain-containing protein [Motiliproteus coralliicola]
MSTVSAPLPGLYRHYKGNEYRVIGTAIHSETEELLVVYQPQYGEGKLWVRPLEMFVGTVINNGAEQPRFELIEADQNGAEL